MKELIKTLKPECTVVFPDVMSLSSDNEEATNLYLELLTRGIYVQFLESPWLNTSHMRLIFRENPIEARGIAINSFMSTLIWKLKDHSLAEPVNVTVTHASMEIKKTSIRIARLNDVSVRRKMRQKAMCKNTDFLCGSIAGYGIQIYKRI